MAPIDLNRIFFKTDTYDPRTKLPIYVLDSTALPNPNRGNFLSLIKLLIDKIPNHNYVLIFFTAGLSNDPSFSITNHSETSQTYINSPNKKINEDSEPFKFSWVWGVKTFSLIPSSKRKFLRKLYIVHESWWIRALTEVLKNLVSSKFLSPSQEKVIHASTLSELSKHVDITKINISLTNYYYEFNKIYNPELSGGRGHKNSLLKRNPGYVYQPKIIVPIHLPDIFGKPINLAKNQLSWYYYNLILIKIIQQYNNYSKKTQLTTPYNLVLFHNNSPSLIFKSNILQDSISRNQLLTLDQYDMFTLINIWKYFLKNLHHDFALIPLACLLNAGCLRCFQESDFKQVNQLANKILEINHYSEILNDLMNLFIIPMVVNDINYLVQNSGSVEVNDISNNYLSKLSKFLAKFFCGIVSDLLEDERILGARLIKGLISYWPFLDINKNRILKKTVPQPPPSRKSSQQTIQIPLSDPIVQTFTNYMNQTDLKTANYRFISSKRAIFNKLQLENLNNFNVVPDSDEEFKHFKHLISYEDLELQNKENQPQHDDEQPLNKIKYNFKNYFKPLAESTNNTTDTAATDLITKSLGSLGFKAKAPAPQIRSKSSNNSFAPLPAPPPPPPRPPRSNTSSPRPSNNSSPTNVNSGETLSTTSIEPIFKKPPIPPPSRVPTFDGSNSPRSLTNQSSQESLQSINSISKKLSNTSINNHNSDSFYSPYTSFSSSVGPTHKLSSASLASDHSYKFVSTTSISSASSSNHVKKQALKVLKKLPQQSEFIYADKKKYAGVEHGKVVKLAQLFEERLETIEILSTMQH